MMIVFSGTDGAGKSTQIGRLEASLESRGVSTRRIWARGGYTPLFSVLKSAIRMVRPSALPRPGGSAERSKKFGSSRLRRAWITFAIVDMMLYYSIWLRVCRLLSGAVICDRYVDDTLLDFERNFPQETVGNWRIWRLLVWSAPRPEHRFLLLVPPEESARRGKLKNEPFPDSPETLAWRYDRYQRLAAAGGWEVLDCRLPIDDVQARIQEVVQPCV